jgi:hypothetical protein
VEYTIAGGKFPRKPGYGNILEACRKDFRNFKRDNGYRLIEDLQSQIRDLTQKRAPNSVLDNQNENLETIRDLIRDGKDDVAFSVFFRTFPSCLPHRTRNL